MQHRPHRLLFVCTANICRSPMAEGLARDEAARRGLPVEVRSGGTMGLVGRAADPKAVSACKSVGVDIADHKSSGITEEDANWADVVLVMELRHQRDLHQRFPQLDGKIVLLGTFGGRPEIDDPVGGWIWRFRKSRDVIHQSIRSFLALLPQQGVPCA